MLNKYGGIFLSSTGMIWFLMALINQSYGQFGMGIIFIFASWIIFIIGDN